MQSSIWTAHIVVKEDVIGYGSVKLAFQQL